MSLLSKISANSLTAEAYEIIRPTFLIIGAQKAGTTVLYSMLAQHERILASIEKEVNFFQDDNNYIKGVDWYHRQFKSVKGDGKLVSFESTPGYLYRVPAAKRIYEYNPQMKLIVLVRNPVERAFSAWNMYRNFSKSSVFCHIAENRSFEDAIGQEFSEIISGKSAAYLGFDRQENCNMPFPGYISRGLYYYQIKRYLKYFDIKQMLVINSKDLMLNSEYTLRRITDFIGVDAFKVNSEVGLESNIGEYRSTINSELSAMLTSFYKKFNGYLSDLINMELDW